MLIQSDAPTSGTHHTTVTDKGSFAAASCSCGWKGPARRARDRARRDASAHTGA
ncbi:hypothetical protein QMK19_31335 [Streptomyces sp. H10-C2]|uniref:hypothetical protein n=1 Tax=unclassified Streptomyces TaxID=2593676 RepID=UPI0024BAC5B5|nr:MULTISPECIES: hypothetical protein [unclassified Streptomyces]MDJ0345112.1 hypothetical protein [Streptomyces sp. PH10-H1]MDJ0374017.1 hypothetical protein [Streptomyces sp. H10-C2]